ncbi:MAG TPA: hypothetical protein PLR88_06720 [Bacteroidales bacterium]|nr:hypothetical protein [Bacteroidales bacterium]
MTQRLILSSILVLLFSLHSYSQLTEGYLKKLNLKSYSEELFAQTDRDIYIAGELVFLKIFKFDGLTHLPSDVSKVVYVDLLDNFSNPVVQIKISADGYSGSGEFRLPDTLRTGNYLIRSCTRWMQNFSRDLFSYKKISVINPFENINQIRVLPPRQNTDSVVFFPESGNLVSGIETRLGIRCFDKYGDPVKMKGFIIDNSNDTLCNVNTDSEGYGFTLIKPSGNGNIYLTESNNNSHSSRFNLPSVKNSGIAISVISDKKDNLIKLKILKNNNFNPTGRNFYLVYSPFSLSPFREEIQIENNKEVKLSQTSLPDGLACISIVDDSNNILAERWIYNERTSTIGFNTRVNNNGVYTREKVKIDITATDSDGNPVESNISVSVVKSFSAGENSINNTKYQQLPRLAATDTDYEISDINDYLIFYSSGDDLERGRQYSSDTTKVFLPELEGHLISGNIRNTVKGEPLRNENLILSFVGKTAQCRFTKTDEAGNFNFVSKEYGIHEIVIQPLSPELNNCYIELNNPFPSVSDKYKTAGFYIDSSKIEDINKAIIGMQIGNIYEPFIKTRIPELHEASLTDFYGKPDNTIHMSNYIELTSLKEVIKEIVPGVTTYKKNDRSNFKLINKYQNQAFEMAPLVLVDGVPVYNFDKVLNINSKDIEKIDVLNTRYFVADVVNEGIINFISKKGNLSAMEFDPSVFRQEFEAFQDSRGFYSPDYSIDSLKNSRIPDFRNTLYWNPDVRTDKTGKATVEFYTSDETGEYSVVINGFSTEGQGGRSVTSFSVNK